MPLMTASFSMGQDVALLLELAQLLAETSEFLPFGRGEPVGAGTFVEICLLDPVADGLSGGFKLGGEFADGAAGSGELYDLLAELGWVRFTCSWHVDLLCGDKWKIVHQTRVLPAGNVRRRSLTACWVTCTGADQRNPSRVRTRTASFGGADLAPDEAQHEGNHHRQRERSLAEPHLVEEGELAVGGGVDHFVEAGFDVFVGRGRRGSFAPIKGDGPGMSDGGRFVFSAHRARRAGFARKLRPA